ncbi:MAG: sigma factor [Phycisphaerales bacterium]
MDETGPSFEEMEHLFRRESGRMVAAVTRVFGVHNLSLAEDVVQDSFCRALEVWSLRGVPENPAAWLVATAKRCAIDALRRERTARTFAPELGRLLSSEWTLSPTVDELFDAGAVKDSMLRMMFSCCHPSLSEESQVALVLHILCGFSVGEVAGAFVSGHDAIEKRITRAKTVLAGSERLFDVNMQAEFVARLPAVQRALYLLFNEGYHGASAEFAVRAELCGEAIRLASLLLEHPSGASPATFALASLMHLNAVRLPARIDAMGDLTPLFEQDRALWDERMIGDGRRLMEQSASGDELSEYHIEAAIASVHAIAPSAAETDWRQIVALYDALLALRPSPIVAMNRAIAVGQSEGPVRGLAELRSICGVERLKSYPFYPAAEGEFELRIGNARRAEECFKAAVALARNATEQRHFERRVRACEAAKGRMKN